MLAFDLSVNLEANASFTPAGGDATAPRLALCQLHQARTQPPPLAHAALFHIPATWRWTSREDGLGGEPELVPQDGTDSLAFCTLFNPCTG